MKKFFLSFSAVVAFFLTSSTWISISALWLFYQTRYLSYFSDLFIDYHIILISLIIVSVFVAYLVINTCINYKRRPGIITLNLSALMILSLLGPLTARFAHEFIVVQYGENAMGTIIDIGRRHTIEVEYINSKNKIVRDTMTSPFLLEPQKGNKISILYMGEMNAFAKRSGLEWILLCPALIVFKSFLFFLSLFSVILTTRRDL